MLLEEKSVCTCIKVRFPHTYLYVDMYGIVNFIISSPANDKYYMTKFGGKASVADFFLD